MCNLMWPDAAGLPFQFITIGAGLSSFFAPLITWPFINSGSPEDGGLSYQQRQLFNYPAEDRACANVNGTNLCPAEETQVQIPYLIMGLLTLPPVVAFMYFYVKEKLIDVSSYDVLPSEPRFRGETRKMRILFAVLLFCFHIPVFGTILAYGDLLVLFGVKGPLDIVMQQMMYMTSLFWGSFLIGRIVACCCSNYIGQFTLMLLNFVGLLAISILLITVGDIYVPALWIGSSALGFFSAPYLPGAMAWASEFITMDGSIIGMCLAASGVGELLIPYIAGTLFNTNGAMSLMYTVFGLTIYQIILFTVMTVVRSNLVKD